MLIPPQQLVPHSALWHGRPPAGAACAAQGSVFSPPNYCASPPACRGCMRCARRRVLSVYPPLCIPARLQELHALRKAACSPPLTIVHPRPPAGAACAVQGGVFSPFIHHCASPPACRSCMRCARRRTTSWACGAARRTARSPRSPPHSPPAASPPPSTPCPRPAPLRAAQQVGQACGVRLLQVRAASCMPAAAARRPACRVTRLQLQGQHACSCRHNASEAAGAWAGGWPAGWACGSPACTCNHTPQAHLLRRTPRKRLAGGGTSRWAIFFFFRGGGGV